MTSRSTPPFRADQVGSLLRPIKLIDARGRAKAGEITPEQLRAVEDDAIRAAVTMQEAAGLKGVTDGEFRRDYWHLDFLAGFDGMLRTTEQVGVAFSGGERPEMVRVVGKVSHGAGIMTDDFRFLKETTRETAKLCIPGPGMVHLRGGRDVIDPTIYPDIDIFWEDLCAAYREEIAQLGKIGCSYLQVDDVSFAYFCDKKFRGEVAARGDDPDELVALYAKLINNAVFARPEGMAVTMHMCRGNFKSTWVAEGGYEMVAEELFGTLEVDGYFMEFDTERAGGFEPLRFVPDGKVVVLGLITSKAPDLEDKDAVKRRIDDASKYVPLDNLCLSPQCGFSSTHHGNDLSEDDQRRKLDLVVTIADEVWGTA